jgi:threonine synthase
MNCSREELTLSLCRSRTPLYRARELERCLGVKGLYLKLEGATPSQNHKYTMAQIAVREAIRLRARGLAVASCGNLGLAVALLCAAYRLACRVFVPAGLPIRLPRSAYVELDTEHASYEDAVAACDGWSRRSEFLNATAGRELRDTYYSAYAPVAEEILEELGQAPGAVICPAGNGTTFASIYRGFRKTRAQLPTHFAVTVSENGFLQTRASPVAIDWLTEPLRSVEPLDREAALDAVAASNGAILSVDPDEMERARHHLRSLEGIECQVASAAPIAALSHLLSLGRLRPSREIIVIMTTGFRAGEHPCI